MRGSVYKQCWCRHPETGRKLHGKCPDREKRGHGSWYFRYEAPKADGEKRRQPVGGPFETRKEAEEMLSAELARVGGGGYAPDRSLRVDAYLKSYQASKVNLKRRSRETDADAFRLYWVPALGHMRLVEVRKRHVEEVLREMLKINRPLPAGEDPSETLRRMLRVRDPAARAAKPLSAARVARMFAPFRSAMKSARPAMFSVSPCEGVELPRSDRVRPLGWTAPREAAFRAELARKERNAEAAKDSRLTTVERQTLWASPTVRPSPVMVWTPGHAGAFLDKSEDERLFALFNLVTYTGLRRDEEIALTWAEMDLDGGVMYVRETGGGQGTKSDAGTRAVPLAECVVGPLRAWRRKQAEERLKAGPSWEDTGLVFTDEHGWGVSGQWVSRRFATLAFKAGLPPVRFHDLRHGAASLMKAAGMETKFISEVLGHERASFTEDVYVLLFADAKKAGAEATAAMVPRARREAR